MNAKSTAIVCTSIALAVSLVFLRSEKRYNRQLEGAVSSLQGEQAKEKESASAEIQLLRNQVERQQSLVQELAKLRGITTAYHRITNEFTRLQKEHGQLVEAVKEQAVTYATLMNQKNGNTAITSEPDLSYLPAVIRPIVSGHSSGRLSMEAIAQRVRLGESDQDVRRQFGISTNHPELQAILNPDWFKNLVDPVPE